MEIKLTDNYLIRQVDTSPFFWDLYLLYEGRRGDKVKVCERNIAYGLRLSDVVRCIGDYELQTTSKDRPSLGESERLTLEEYIDKFEEIQDNAINRILDLEKKILNSLKD